MTEKTTTVVAFPINRAALKAAQGAAIGSRYAGGVDENGRPTAGLTIAPQRPGADAIRAAELSLPRAEEAMAPVGAQELSEWLHALGAVLPVGGATSKERVVSVVKACVEACGTMPRVCFSQESRAKVMRNCEFFPGPAKLHGILAEIEAEGAKRLWGLREIAKHAHLPAPRRDDAPTVTDADREHVAARLAEAKAHLAEVTARRQEGRGATAAISPAYLDKLTLARQATPQVLASRPDYREALRMAGEG